MIDPIGNGAGAGSGVNRFENMSSEDFLRIMFTELTSQSPLDPQDSNQIMEQISLVRDIESNVKLMDKLESLVSQNEFAAAGGLIGQTVEGLNEELFSVTGRVTSVSKEGDLVILTLDTGDRMRFSNMTAVHENHLGT
ncbi:MAG: flagellar hook capping FlgD N-terminal domain-containing protein [Phycisphaerales bacterium]